MRAWVLAAVAASGFWASAAGAATIDTEYSCDVLYPGPGLPGQIENTQCSGGKSFTQSDYGILHRFIFNVRNVGTRTAIVEAYFTFFSRENSSYSAGLFCNDVYSCGELPLAAGGTATLTFFVTPEVGRRGRDPVLNLRVTAVPVPASAGFVLLGLMGLGGMKISRRRTVRS